MSGQLNYSKAIEECSPTASRTIFDGPGNRITCDPAQIRLLSDRCLIRDLPQDDSRSGSLVVPETAQNGGVGKGGNFRIGLVVAVGEGDRFSEHGLDAEGAVRRRLLTAQCRDCDGNGVTVLGGCCENVPEERIACDECENGRVPIVVPPQCKVGDTVLYDRRRQEQMYFNGVLHQLCHAEQGVLAVLGVSDGE